MKTLPSHKNLQLLTDLSGAKIGIQVQETGYFKDVILEGLTSLNVSIINFYDFYLFHYIY